MIEQFVYIWDKRTKLTVSTFAQKEISKNFKFLHSLKTISIASSVTRLDPNNKKRPDISIHNPQTIGYENENPN